jgi:DNA-binding MarR family transcriptional regulator
MTSAVPLEAIRGLARASRMLERASGELTLAQYRVLASIASGDERASRIAERLALGKPTISATVDSLRQRGLLTRSGVEADQRAATLALTGDGIAALAVAEQAMAERISWIASRTPDPAAVLQTLVWLDGAIDELLAQRAAAGERP